MNYAASTGISIQDAFQKFHVEHPEVYEAFKKYAKDLIKAQLKMGVPQINIKTSSKLVINRIRWEMAEVGQLVVDFNNEHTKKMDYSDFKINDAFSSRYARLWCEDHAGTWLSNVFNQRRLRA